MKALAADGDGATRELGTPRDGTADVAEPDLPLEEPAPLSVPPWWNVKKKNALYFSAIAHGDHAR